MTSSPIVSALLFLILVSPFTPRGGFTSKKWWVLLLWITFLFFDFLLLVRSIWWWSGWLLIQLIEKMLLLWWMTSCPPVTLFWEGTHIPCTKYFFKIICMQSRVIVLRAHPSELRCALHGFALKPAFPTDITHPTVDGLHVRRGPVLWIGKWTPCYREPSCYVIDSNRWITSLRWSCINLRWEDPGSR